MRALTCLAACAVLVACAPERPPSAERGGVLLIAIDSLRVDHVSCYGYDRDTTPEIDRIVSQGVRFENAFAAAPGVLPSNVALLTGCDPRIAERLLPPDVPGTTLTYWSLPREAPYLAQELLREGFATAAFVDHPQIGTALGFSRGFQEFQDVPRVTAAEARPPAADELFDRMARWLDELEPGEPWFAYVHVSGLERFWWHYDERGESRYRPRPQLARVPPVGDAERLFHALPRSHWAGAQRSIAEYEVAYDAALHRIDAAVGACMDRLRQTGRLERTTVVVCGTRGLGFGESGLIGDVGMLADVDLHVPLVIRPADGRPFQPGLATPALASLIDVAPTLLALSGLPLPADMLGLSQVDALSSATARPRELAMASCGLLPGSVAISPTHCLEVTEPWRAEGDKLVRSWYGGPPPSSPSPRVVLHDRARDPSLGHASSAALDDRIVAPLRAAAAAWDARVETLRRRYHPSDWRTTSEEP